MFCLFFTEPRSNQRQPLLATHLLSHRLLFSGFDLTDWSLVLRITAECLLIVIILNVNFVPDFEAEVWSRFWCWVFIKLLGEALTLVRTLSPLVHCAFAMFLFGSLVSLAMLLFWRLNIKQADESAFPPLLSSSSWCKPLFWNNSQLGRNHSSPNYPTSQIFGKKTCSV